MSNEQTMYNVKNRSAGMVVYKIPDMNIRRVFQAGEIKKISHKELEALSFAPGGRELIADYLQIRNIEALNELDIHYEQEYFMDKDQVIELIKIGTLDQWIDALNFAPAGVIELIKQLSVEVPLNDYNKRQELKKLLNFDVDKAIVNNIADTADEVIVPAAPARRAANAIVDQSIVAEATRKTTTDKYKIVSEG